MPDAAPLELIEPPHAADERSTLTGFLDFYRSVLIRKADALTVRQLDTAVAPSTLTLGQLVRHMTMVESHWFEQVFARPTGTRAMGISRLDHRPRLGDDHGLGAVARRAPYRLR